jgi:hypothetical protein
VDVHSKQWNSAQAVSLLAQSKFSAHCNVRSNTTCYTQAHRLAAVSSCSYKTTCTYETFTLQSCVHCCTSRHASTCVHTVTTLIDRVGVRRARAAACYILLSIRVIASTGSCIGLGEWTDTRGAGSVSFAVTKALIVQL